MPAQAGSHTIQRRRWLTAYAPLIIWTIFTLGLGSGAASMSETSRFIRPLLEWLFPAADADSIYLYHAAIRKLAHVFQYGVLCLLAFNVFRSANRPSLLALFYVAVIAVIDEVQQSFDPARTATPVDVLLDIAGALLALGSFSLIRRYRRAKA